MTLTTSGKATRKRAAEAFDAAAEDFFSPFSPSDRARFTAMLKQLIVRG